MLCKHICGSGVLHVISKVINRANFNFFHISLRLEFYVCLLLGNFPVSDLIAFKRFTFPFQPCAIIRIKPIQHSYESKAIEFTLFKQVSRLHKVVPWLPRTVNKGIKVLTFSR